MNDITTIETFTFEDFKNQNGITYWWASDLMQMLGYSEMKAFHKVLDRTTKALVNLGIPHYDNIIPTQKGDSQDFKLTRFACYMAAMNGDPKKSEVAQAQAYFASQTRQFELAIQGSVDIDRLLIRDEIAEGNKSLGSAASRAGVENYAKFQNAGYLGMYNMESWKLEKKRGVNKGKLFDTMSRTELAANLFRITQTEERIKSQNITGQQNLEKTHRSVGKEVREIVIKNTGLTPESLPQSQRLPEVKKALKVSYKEIGKIDKGNKK